MTKLGRKGMGRFGLSKRLNGLTASEFAGRCVKTPPTPHCEDTRHEIPLETTELKYSGSFLLLKRS